MVFDIDLCVDGVLNLFGTVAREPRGEVVELCLRAPLLRGLHT